MSGKGLSFIHVKFLFCSPPTGCIRREEEVFQPNWISVWSQLKPVGRASLRLWGVGWCLLFLCQGKGNWLFPFEQLISASHLQSSLPPVVQEQQGHSWVGGGFFPERFLQKNKVMLFLLAPPFPFSATDTGSPSGPHPCSGGCGCRSGCWAQIGD